MSDTTTKAQRTNLEVPDDIREMIERQAQKDMRTYKAEIVALVLEALKARGQHCLPVR